MSNNRSTTPGSSSPTLPRGLVSRRGGLMKSTDRMTSLRPPRDLTLGGKPKKSFKPNIPARREKKDDPSDSSSAASSSSSSAPREKERRSFRDGNNRGGPGGRGRGRGRRQPETIQIHSIFEQGPVERSNRGRGSSYGGGGGGADGAFSSRQSGGMKKLSIKREDYDSGMLDDLLRDDFIDDPVGTTDTRYNPVHLPLTMSLPKKEKKEPPKEEEKMEVDEKEELKTDVKVKSEPPDKDVEMKEFVKPAPVSDKFKPPAKAKAAASKTHEQITAASLFGGGNFDSEGELVFFQLPDTLPSYPSTSEDDERSKPVIKQEKDVAGSAHSQQKESDQDKSAEGSCSLKDIPEGYLGKLQVMKSGKTRLVLGNIKLDVSMGSPCGFLQDVVSLKLGGEKGGELVTLGHINHRVVCTPDFEQLLQAGS